MADRGRPISGNESPSGRSGKRRATREIHETSGQQQVDPNLRPSPVTLNQYQPVAQVRGPFPSQDRVFQLPTLTHSSTQAHPGQHLAAAKVAIPRLRRDSNISQTTAAEKQRVAHACEPCRQRKSKCSGDRPVCKHCADFKISCVYADGKRDRSKK